MKLRQVLDASGTRLSFDPKNQRILKELVSSEYSVTELARRLNIPMVTTWKRMQKLLAAGLIEVSTVRKTGNLEKKLYRSTAATFVSEEFLSFRPTDPHLVDAFEIYSQIRGTVRSLLTRMNAIPTGVDPIDYAIYVTMLSFAQVCGTPETQRRIAVLSKKLAEYRVHR